MTAAGDLVEFLLARIADDEADAHSDGRRCTWPGMWSHWALSVTAAHRRIIAPALPQDADMLDWPDETPAEGNARRQGAAQALHFTLCHLATVYSDHPDFRPEWAHPGRRP